MSEQKILEVCVTCGNAIPRGEEYSTALHLNQFKHRECTDTYQRNMRALEAAYRMRRT
jgi:hypothetical protein